MSKFHKSSLYLTWTFAVLVVAAFMWQVFASGPAPAKQEEPSAVKPVASTPAANHLPAQPIEKPVIALPVKADPTLQVVKKIAPEMHKFAAIKLANGVETPVYPTDPLNPYHDFSFSSTVPIAIAGIRWDKESRNLEVDADYTIPAAAEYRLKSNLLARFKENGYPQLAADTLSIMRLEPVAYTLALEAHGQDIILFESKPNTLPTKQTVRFQVPFTAEYARLDDTLNRTPQAVNVVFTAKYSYQSIMGGSASTRVTHAAFEALREEMRGPRGEKPAGDFLVYRVGSADVKKRFRQLVNSSVTLYVGENEREFVLSRLDRDIDKNLGRLTEPLSVKNLWELAEDSLVWKAKFPGQAEVTPNSFNDLIRRARELKDDEEKTVQIAKSLVDTAKDDKVDIRDFHKTASTLALSASASIRIAIFGGSAKFSLNRTWDELTENERHEAHSARSLMKNESEFMRHVRSRHESEVEGELRLHKSFAKTLEIDRISNVGIAQINSAGGTISWVNGVVTIAKPIAVPLLVVKEAEQDDDRDVAKELLVRIRKVEAAQRDAANEILAQIRKVEAAQENFHSDFVGTWETNYFKNVVDGKGDITNPQAFGEAKLRLDKEGKLFLVRENGTTEDLKAPTHIGSWTCTGRSLVVYDHTWAMTSAGGSHTVLTLTADKQWAIGVESGGHVIRWKKVMN